MEAFLIDAEKGYLCEADTAEYRRPFLEAGEDRPAMLTWLRETPLDGSPPDVVKIVSEVRLAKEQSRAETLDRGPGFIAHGRFASFCEDLDQTEVAVKGRRFVQQSSGADIGTAVADLVRRLQV